MEKKFKTYKDFWPFYLKEHSSTMNRKLHFVGTSLVFIILFYSLWTQNWLLMIALPVVGYAFAWVGHFLVEKNRPATFTYPLWSLRGDFQMFFYTLTGKLESEIESIKNQKISH